MSGSATLFFLTTHFSSGHIEKISREKGLNSKFVIIVKNLRTPSGLASNNECET